MTDTKHTAAQPLDLDKLVDAYSEAWGKSWDSLNPLDECEPLDSECRLHMRAGIEAVVALIAKARAAQPVQVEEVADGGLAITQDWMAYCTILRQAGKEPPDAQGDAFEFAWNAARAAQPENATGTTWASIDTPEFRELLYCLDHTLRRAWASRADDLIAHIDAIIGDHRNEVTNLRAQLAQVQSNSDDISAHLGVMVQKATELRAQLAAKGHGEPIYQVYNWDGISAWTDTDNDHYDTVKEADRRIVYLVAPASAQPDRGAAQGDRWQVVPKVPTKEMIDNIAAFVDGHENDAEVIYRAMLAAAPSPASQPVAPETNAQQDAAPSDIALELLHYPSDDGHILVRLDDVKEILARRAAAVAPSDAKGKADDLTGRIVSVDVSTGDDDYGNRIFAELTGETGSDGTTLLAIETERNFGATGQSPATSAADARDAAQDFARGAIAALAVMTSHGHPHGSTYHDDIVRTVGEKVIYSVAEDDDYAWAGLNPRKKPKRAAMAAAPSSEKGGNHG